MINHVISSDGKQQGFTLIELIVIIVVILISTIIIACYLGEITRGIHVIEIHIGVPDLLLIHK